MKSDSTTDESRKVALTRQVKKCTYISYADHPSLLNFKSSLIKAAGS